MKYDIEKKRTGRRKGTSNSKIWEHEELKKVLLEWFQHDRSLNYLMGAVVTEKSTEITASLNTTEFKIFNFVIKIIIICI